MLILLLNKMGNNMNKVKINSRWSLMHKLSPKIDECLIYVVEIGLRHVDYNAHKEALNMNICFTQNCKSYNLWKTVQ